MPHPAGAMPAHPENAMNRSTWVFLHAFTPLGGGAAAALAGRS
jgi:hypothetical protein